MRYSYLRAYLKFRISLRELFHVLFQFLLFIFLMHYTCAQHVREKSQVSVEDVHIEGIKKNTESTGCINDMVYTGPEFEFL